MAPNDRDDDDATWIARAVDRAGIGVFRVDHAAQTFARASDAAARIVGAASGEAMVGRSILDLYTDPKERAEIAARLMADARFRETGRATIRVRRLRQDTREVVDLRIHTLATFDAEGRVASMECLVEEVGDDRVTERAFQKSEERFRVLFETSSVAMALAALDGTLSRVNPAFCAFVGRSEAALSGARLGDLLAEEHRPTSLTPSRGAPGGVRLGELAFPKADGSTAWGLVTASWLGDAGDASPHSIVFVIQDITERKKTEQSLARVARLEALGVLAGGLAHDLNNALSVVLASLDVVSREMPSVEGAASDDLRELLADAERGARRSAELAGQLLAFAKGGAPTRRVTDVGQLLRAAVSLCLRGTAAAIETSVPDDLPRCELDPLQIAQVFENLLINAAQASSAGARGPGRIRVGARRVETTSSDALPLRPGSYVLVTVSDEGVGIAREHLDRVFDPYFTTKAGGTGLGLAVAHSIVVKHGGHCAVESAEGHGTTFEVYLPTTDLEPARPIEAKPLPKSATARRVLVMDDDDAIRKVALRVLSQSGFDAIGAREGAEALALYREALAAGRAFDVVILDLTIPGGMGGEETMRRLRELDAGVRAVVTSGYADSPVVTAWRAHGFAGALGKPFTPAELLRETHGAIGATEPLRGT